MSIESIDPIRPIEGTSPVRRAEEARSVPAHALLPLHLAPISDLASAIAAANVMQGSPSSVIDTSLSSRRSTSIIPSSRFSTASPSIAPERRSSPLEGSLPSHTPPELAIPRRSLTKNYRDKLVSLLETSENRVAKDIEYDTQKLSEISEDLEAEYQKFLAKIREIAAKEKSIESWSYLSRMASCLLSAGALIAGGIMISGGAVLPGAMMISSGVAGLAGLGLSHLGFDKRLTGAISLASGAMSLLGGGLGYHLIADQSARLILTVANAAFGIASGITTYEAGMAEANKAFMQQQKIIHEQEVEIYKLYHLETSDDAKQTSTPLIELTHSVRQILKEQDQMKLRILQEVT